MTVDCPLVRLCDKMLGQLDRAEFIMLVKVDKVFEKSGSVVSVRMIIYTIQGMLPYTTSLKACYQPVSRARAFIR